MSLNIRRVVTGHNEQGKAVVQFDEISDNVISRRPGHASAVIWSTDTFPSDLADTADAAQRKVDTALSSGTVFRVARFDPGVAGRMHRTTSLDYAVVISGAIDMELDEGEVRLNAGDVLVQRGTLHNWINRGVEPCIIAFVLVGAAPLEVENVNLDAIG
jgi:mannose-6-phosphate isomerase-like protein (cupin superfamily)